MQHPDTEMVKSQPTLPMNSPSIDAAKHKGKLLLSSNSSTGQAGGDAIVRPGFWGHANKYAVPLALLCGYVFFKGMKPSEDYLTTYLVKVIGLSESQTYDDVYPVWTYVSVPLLAIAVLLTDRIGYRTVILIEAAAYLITRILLLWGKSLLAMQCTQASYALATSAEIGYNAYLYSLLPDPHSYQVGTGALNAAVLGGQMAASVIGQVTVSVVGAPTQSVLVWLTYVSFASVLVATVFACLLPPSRTDVVTLECPCTPKLKDDHLHDNYMDDEDTLGLWATIKAFYSVPTNVEWSVWYALGTCGLYQVQQYDQNLWQVITGDKSKWNSAANILATGLGILASGLAARVNATRISKARRLILALASAGCAACLLGAAVAQSQWLGYATIMLFLGGYMFIATLVSAKIAEGAAHLSRHRFGLILGLNMLAALVLESVLQLAVGSTGFNLGMRAQFVLYGLYFAVQAVGYAVLQALALLKCCNRHPLPSADLNVPLVVPVSDE